MHEASSHMLNPRTSRNSFKYLQAAQMAVEDYTAMCHGTGVPQSLKLNDASEATAFDERLEPNPADLGPVERSGTRTIGTEDGGADNEDADGSSDSGDDCSELMAAPARLDRHRASAIVDVLLASGKSRPMFDVEEEGSVWNAPVSATSNRSIKILQIRGLSLGKSTSRFSRQHFVQSIIAIVRSTCQC